MQAIATAFRMLTTGPDPLALDGAVVRCGLPRRPIPLPELRAILLHPATSRQARDVVWRRLVGNARGEGSAWVIGAVGVALPALRRMAAGLGEGYRGDVEDLHSAVLTGFVGALQRIDIDRPGVITRLRWAAYRAGVTARYTRDGVPAVSLPPLESQPPPYPWGHPDLVLLDAVAKGVLSPVQAELIGRSRLENLTLKEAAAELDVGYEAACKARQRGETRLIAAIAAGDVERRLSAPALNTGLLPVTAASAPELAGVRDGSTESDGTSEPDHPDEKGAFCDPAHQPPPPDRPRRARRHRSGNRRRPRRGSGGGIS